MNVEIDAHLNNKPIFSSKCGAFVLFARWLPSIKSLFWIENITFVLAIPTAIPRREITVCIFFFGAPCFWWGIQAAMSLHIVCIFYAELFKQLAQNNSVEPNGIRIG